MKIGIITQPLRFNFGCILQNYALHTVLKRMDHSPVTLDKPTYFQIYTPRMIYKYCKRIVKKMLGKKCLVFRERQFNRECDVTCKNTRRFIDSHINKMEIADYNTLSNADYDALIVGSDQVWRPAYNDHVEDAYLGFAKNWNVKRIAYAASFGTNKWEYSRRETQRCRSLLKRFDAVSVRESDAVQICKDRFQVNAQHVLDPTMLLQKEDYESLIPKEEKPEDNAYILTYILDKKAEVLTLIKEYAKRKGLPTKEVNSRIQNPSAPLEERIQPPVEDWLRGFRDAEFVITDSFHACVFSTIFHKQFAVFANYKRGYARFSSLLDMCGISPRFITSVDDFDKLERIDYNLVEKNLSEMRKSSINFLNFALS